MSDPRDIQAELIRRTSHQMQEIARLRVDLDVARESNKMLTSALLAKEGDNFDNATAEIGRLRAALKGASHALRSYQYGNASTELAEAQADAIDALLAGPASALEAEAQKKKGGRK